VFTSQSLRAIVRPGAISIREHRLDDVVHQVEVRGTIDAETTPELARRIDGALAALGRSRTVPRWPPTSTRP